MGPTSRTLLHLLLHLAIPRHLQNPHSLLLRLPYFIEISTLLIGGLGQRLLS